MQGSKVRAYESGKASVDEFNSIEKDLSSGHARRERLGRLLDIQTFAED